MSMEPGLEYFTLAGFARAPTSEQVLVPDDRKWLSLMSIGCISGAVLGTTHPNGTLHFNGMNEVSRMVSWLQTVWCEYNLGKTC